MTDIILPANGGRPYFLFLTGTSQVGKTELWKRFPEEVRTEDILLDRVPVEKISMSAHDIREMIGFPTWEDLRTDVDLMMRQQTFIMKTYVSRIQEALQTSRTQRKVFLFERSTLDCVGYTYAFLHLNPAQLPPQQIKEHLLSLTVLRNALLVQIREEIKRVTEREIYYFQDILLKTNYSIPYDLRNGQRPPIDVRMLCEKYLEGCSLTPIQRSCLAPLAI